MFSALEIERAAGASASAPLADGWIDAVGSARLLAGTEPVVLRTFEHREGPEEKLADGAGETRYGPTPPELVFLRIDKGSDVQVIRVDGSKSADELTGVTLEPTTLEWGDAKAPFSRSFSGVGLKLKSGLQLQLTSPITESEEQATALAASLGSALAIRTGLPFEATVSSTERESETEDSALLPLSDGAAYTFTIEGDLVVLRDFSSEGDRSNAGVMRIVSFVLVGLAALSWSGFAVPELRASGIAPMLGTGAVALVLSIAAFAFFEIARFAGNYKASSHPLVWFGDDRMVVAPWVSRGGRVDTRPYGKLGAAIRTAEIGATTVLPKDGVFAVEVDTHHGAMEIVRVSHQPTAEKLARAVASAIESVSAPSKKKTASQRSKERAAKA